MDSRAIVTVVIATAAVALIACSQETPEATSSAPAPVEATNTPPASDSGTTDDADAAPPSTFKPPPTCTSFTYSEWSVCRFDSTQVRTVVSTVPADCYGGGPALKQSCAFTVPSDGPGLYDAYCSGCHGTSKKGSSASAIKGAIDGNRGGMSVVSSLTPDQIALIASAK